MLGLVERIFFEIRHIMDPLTQCLLGACVCGGLFSKQLGRWSWAVGLVAGLLADADMLVNLWMTPLDALYFHRHFTHTLWFIPIGGLIACLPFLFVPKLPFFLPFSFQLFEFQLHATQRDDVIYAGIC